MARIHITELEKLSPEDIKTLLEIKDLSLQLSAEPEQIELLRSAYACWTGNTAAIVSEKDDLQMYCEFRIAEVTFPRHPEWRLVTMEQAKAMSDYEIMSTGLRGNQKIWLAADGLQRAELLKAHAEWFGVAPTQIQEVILEVDGNPETISNWNLYAANRINGATISRNPAASMAM